MNKIVAKFKKRIWLASLGNGFIISFFISIHNHTIRDYIFLGVGIIILLMVYLQPLKSEQIENYNREKI